MAGTYLITSIQCHLSNAPHHQIGACREDKTNSYGGLPVQYPLQAKPSLVPSRTLILNTDSLKYRHFLVPTLQAIGAGEREGWLVRLYVTDLSSSCGSPCPRPAWRCSPAASGSGASPVYTLWLLRTYHRTSPEEGDRSGHFTQR